MLILVTAARQRSCKTIAARSRVRALLALWEHQARRQTVNNDYCNDLTIRDVSAFPIRHGELRCHDTKQLGVISEKLRIREYSAVRQYGLQRYLPRCSRRLY